MLDPRIYRTGFVAVGLAVVVLAFSLINQQGSAGSSLAPEAFSGASAFSTMNNMARTYPHRRPGSAGDDALASAVARGFGQVHGWSVATDVFRARTVDGMRTLENVTATRVGLQSGTILVVAHRDSLSSPSEADLSGTATLMELARVLAGETQQHSIVLASTSGSTGTAGAARLAATIPGPVDAVIVLGDLAGIRTTLPTIVPWSNSQLVAPTMLRNTLAGALGAQAGLPPGGVSLAGQVAHLALPITTTEQGPFGAAGQPAVLLSVSGERAPAPDEPVSVDRITGLGRSVLQTVSALDGAGAVPAPSAYLLYQGKVIPAWPIRLFVLALMLPVFLATVDGLARARRRGHPVLRWGLWVLLGAVPFMLALALIKLVRLAGLLDFAPPGPVSGDAVPLHTWGVVLMAGTLVLVVIGFALRRPVMRLLGGGRRLGSPVNAGAGAATLVIFCVVSLLVWLGNPFAALLLIPALHFWLWLVDPDLRLPIAVRALFLVLGLVPFILAVLYCLHLLGPGAGQALWNGVLLFAGGSVPLRAALEWSVVLGCFASVLVISVRALRQSRPDGQPVTVRGPVTYAGPGSLGGTESALRR